jgi:hypothetical protein
MRSEFDPELSLRGFLLAATNRPWSEISQLNSVQLSFLYFWVKKFQMEQEHKMGRILGTRWTVREIRQAGKKNNPGQGSKTYKDDEEINIPLSLAINPELLEGLVTLVGGAKVGGGEYTPQAGEEVVELSSLSKEDFQKVINGVFQGWNPSG